MKTEFLCPCDSFPEIINLNEHYDDFYEAWPLLEKTPQHGLHECPHCFQLWRIDERGSSNVLYGIKLEQHDGWDTFDASAIIKAQMLRLREGVSERVCKKATCSDHAVNGSVYCLEHLYQSGARM